MSERERWIVYPLLFFALGAALRDKYTQQVQTDRVHASHITCEEITIVDPETPDRIVARLGSDPLQATNTAGANRYGVLQLIDVANKNLCTVTNNQLVVGEIGCKGLAVIDPANGKILANLTSAESRTSPTAAPERVGVLLLNNQKFGGVMTAPPNPKGAAPAEKPPAPPDAAPPSA
jgi:hypothetical protein